MNAKEAREKSLRITGEAERTQYQEIKQKINRETDSGNLTCKYFKSLMPAVKLKLEEEGFNISVFFEQRDGTIVTISW